MKLRIAKKIHRRYFESWHFVHAPPYSYNRLTTCRMVKRMRNYFRTQGVRYRPGDRVRP